MKDIFKEMTLERDRQELSLSDTLDVKASILLAVIAVLGTLSGILLTIPKLGQPMELAQLFAILCLALACLFAVLTVLPRNYLLADKPSSYEEWGDKLREFYPVEADRDAAIVSGVVREAAKRIAQNHSFNKQKSNLLALSFWPALVALAINIVTLTILELLKVLS